jgi:uncharacterized protein (TIGR03435 family)
LVAQLPIVVAGVWLCGMVAVLLVWVVQWRRVAAAMRRARRVESGREFEILRRVDVRGEVRLRMSRELMEPGVFGVWRPVLLWPEQLSLRLQDEHIAAIVAHELMHVRRRDNLAAMLHMVVEAAFWFHPMVWWMERRMVEERERACDEAVVELGAEAGVYAESLLKAVRFCVESPLTCVAGISGADLSRRVRSIMTLRLESLSLGRKVGLGLLGCAMVLGPIGFGVMRMIPVYGQVLRATGPRPSFEVATIKPSKPDENKNQEMGLRDGRYHATHVSLRNLIKYAYQVKMDDQLVGGPSWVDKEFFDVEAKIGESDLESMKNLSISGKVDQFALRLQSLLEDRFQLKVVDETRELPAYALVVAKGGPKLKEVSVSPEIAAAIKPPPPPPPPPPGSSSARPGSVRPFQDQAGSVGPRYLPMPPASAIVPLPKAGVQPVAFVQGGVAPSGTGTQAATPVTAGPPSFEVATIRPGDPHARSSGLNLGGDGIELVSMPLNFLLKFAYNLNAGSDDQIVGAPSWVSSTPFYIHAKEDEALAAKIDKMSPDERVATLRRMTQALLADRFHLKLHHETRELPVLALTVAKGGPKLTLVTASNANDGTAPATPDDWKGLHNPGRGKTEGRDVPIKLLADTLSWQSEIGGRLVIDATGLQGNYNFKLNWTPDNASTRVGDSDAGGPSLFAALQEQLELKLESRKAPVDCIVIDHVEMPSGN